MCPYGRLPDGGETWSFLDSTPGGPNRLSQCPRAQVVGIRYEPFDAHVGEPIAVKGLVVAAAPLTGVVVAYAPPGADWPPQSGAPGWTFVEAFDDGLHDDGEAGDGWFAAQIPAFDSRRYVQYAMLVSFETGSPVVSSRCYFNYGYEAPSLCINEILAMNRFVGTWLAGSVGPFPDFIELYNYGDSPLDLGAVSFRQTYEDVQLWTCTVAEGTILAPGEHLLVWASREIYGLAPVGIDLSLSHNGEEILLIAPDEVSIIDAVRYPPLGQDTAYGRDPEGTGDFRILDAPTPQGGSVFPPGVAAFIGSTAALPLPDEPIPIRVWVSRDVEPVQARVRYRVEGLEDTTALYNDGVHGDDNAGDEIYGGAIPPVGRRGLLELAVEVETSEGTPYRDPAVHDQWYRINVGESPAGGLVLNEVFATRHTGGSGSSICPAEWPPPGGGNQQAKSNPSCTAFS